MAAFGHIFPRLNWFGNNFAIVVEAIFNYGGGVVVDILVGPSLLV